MTKKKKLTTPPVPSSMKPRTNTWSKKVVPSVDQASTVDPALEKVSEVNSKHPSMSGRSRDVSWNSCVAPQEPEAA